MFKETNKSNKSSEITLKLEFISIFASFKTLVFMQEFGTIHSKDKKHIKIILLKSSIRIYASSTTEKPQMKFLQPVAYF